MSAHPALAVRTDDPLPPYEQLRRQLADLIRTGVLAAGDRLPPLRQLAGDLGLAPGTVARTYRELEAGGLVTSRRGAGTRVAQTAPGMTSGERDAVAELTAGYVRAASRLGADSGQILAAVRQALHAPA